MKWAVLFLALAAALLFGLGGRGLWNLDEGRYSEIAREMLDTGDWLTPRLNGVVYSEKPPLLYWTTAASFRLLGRQDGWSARLPMVAATLLTCAVLAWTARRRLGDEAAFWATAAYGSCFYVFTISHVVVTDGLLTLGICATFAALEWGRDREGRGPALLLGAGLALGVLAKGPIGAVLPALGLGLECLLARSLEPLRRVRGAGLACLVACALVLPWFVLESRAVPGFLRFFLVHEHLQRFATDVAHREEPLWHFPVVLAAGWCPWWAWLWTGGRQGWRDPAAGGTLRAALAWSAAAVLFFSVSRSKLPTYVWPVFPLMALAAGWGGRLHAPGGGRSWRLGMGVLIGVGAALAVVSWPGSASRAYGGLAPMAPVGLAFGLALAGLGILARLPGPAGPWILLAGLLTVEPAVLSQGGRLDASRCAREAAAAILADDPDGRGIVVNHRGLRTSLPFYLRRRVVLWGNPGEMAFGMRQLPPAERDRWFLDTAADPARADARMAALWGGSGKVYLVMRETQVAEVPLSPPGRLLFKAGGQAVLVNQ